MARQVTGVDVGTRTARFLKGYYKGNTFHATGFSVSDDPGDSIESTWESAEPGFKPVVARVGITGREMNLRYTRVPRVPDWQLRRLMRFEVEEVGGTSGAAVASDFNLLPDMPEIEGEDVVLLAMAREDLLETHAESLADAGGSLDSFAPASLALYNAFLRYGVIEDDTVLIANIGHENLDVVICRGPDLVFARNLSGGSTLFDSVLATQFGVSPRKAEDLKKRLVDLTPGAQHKDSNHEKASRAALAPAGQLLSLLQSTVLFSKGQLKIPNLKVDRVLLCGGGAALEGLCPYLTQGMGVSVELFDPFRVVETDGLSPEESDLLEEYQLESVVALGLATMASDSEAYSIEILPESVRKRRDLMNGTAFLIAAVVFAIAYLGWSAMTLSSSLGELEGDVKVASRRLQDAKRTEKQTFDLQQRSAVLNEYAGDLMLTLGTGEQLARSLEALHKSLPEEFWLTNLETKVGQDKDLLEDKEEQPFLRIEGRAREGTRSMSVLYEQFIARLKAELPMARIVPQPNVRGTQFALGLTLFGGPDSAAAELDMNEEDS
jgi:Tfp pilus assembly PilM family ATPase/Tfp pilus assembly protein PilN